MEPTFSLLRCPFCRASWFSVVSVNISDLDVRHVRKLLPGAECLLLPDLVMIPSYQALLCVSCLIFMACVFHCAKGNVNDWMDDSTPASIDIPQFVADPHSEVG